MPSVTELAGVSSAGKTQFCLQLALTVQLPFSRGGLEGGERTRNISVPSDLYDKTTCAYRTL